MQEKNPTKEQKLIEEEIEKRVKLALWSILDALGVPREKSQKYKWYPEQLTGLVIAHIKALQTQNQRLRKINKHLNGDLNKQRQLEAFFAQVAGHGRVSA
jgi:hypothetical protein